MDSSVKSVELVYIDLSDKTDQLPLNSAPPTCVSEMYAHFVSGDFVSLDGKEKVHAKILQD